MASQAQDSRGSRALRQAPDSLSLTRNHAAPGYLQDPVFARTLSIWPSSGHQLSAPLPQHGRGPVYGTPHPDPLWDEPVTGQSEASIHGPSLASIREAAAWAPLAGRREIPGKSRWLQETPLSVHGYRRLHAHPCAQDLRRLQPEVSHQLRG